MSETRKAKVTEETLDNLVNIDDLESVELENEGEESSSVDILSLLDIDVNDNDLLERQASLSIPSGTYVWLDNKVNITVDFDDDNKSARDVAQKKGLDKGRCLLNVSGIVQMVDSARKGRFSFQLSPDIRKKDDDLDFASQNYAKVEQLFFKLYERKQKKESEIVTLIQSCVYSMYITYNEKTSRNYLRNFNLK